MAAGWGGVPQRMHLPHGGSVHSSYFPKSQSCCMRNVLPRQKAVLLLPGDFDIHMEMAHWRSGSWGGEASLGGGGDEGCGLIAWLWIQVCSFRLQGIWFI